MSSFKKNIGYQSLLEVLNTCLPLITAPYLSRVLGAEMLGIYSYTQSIVNFFVLLSMLGVRNYGSRSISLVKDNKLELSKTFWEIYVFQIISSVSSLILYFTYCVLLDPENILIVLIQSCAIVACIFDISWLFSGVEMFKETVRKNMAIRIITVALILLFVKSPNDLWLYVTFMLGGTLLSQLWLWIYVPKLVYKVHLSWANIVRHIKPNVVLFLPHLAMSIYHLMDKTMLGWLSNYEQSGLYYNADKIINIPIGILSGICAVMLPRITYLVGNNEIKEATRLSQVSTEGISILSISMTCGIIAVSPEFIPVFFGDGYTECILLTVFLAPVLYIKAISSLVRSVYIIPYKLDRIYVQSVIAGAIVNLICNLILIPHYHALGAVIGTFLAELTVCLWQNFAIIRRVNVFKSIVKSGPYYLFGIMMIACVRLAFQILNTSLLLSLIIEICVGIVVYTLLCCGYGIITKNDLFEAIKHEFRKK